MSKTINQYTWVQDFFPWDLDFFDVFSCSTSTGVGGECSGGLPRFGCTGVSFTLEFDGVMFMYLSIEGCRFGRGVFRLALCFISAEWAGLGDWDTAVLEACSSSESDSLSSESSSSWTTQSSSLWPGLLHFLHTQLFTHWLNLCPLCRHCEHFISAVRLPVVWKNTCCKHIEHYEVRERVFNAAVTQCRLWLPFESRQRAYRRFNP